MTAARLDIEIRQGRMFRKRFIYQDDQGKQIDLSGYDAHLQIFDQTGSLIVDGNVANGMTTLGVEGVGEIVLAVPKDVTSQIDFSFGSYELALIQPNGEELSLLEGKAIVARKGLL